MCAPAKPEVPNKKLMTSDLLQSSFLPALVTRVGDFAVGPNLEPSAHAAMFKVCSRGAW
jgi:hypothetical protein